MKSEKEHSSSGALRRVPLATLALLSAGLLPACGEKAGSEGAGGTLLDGGPAPDSTGADGNGPVAPGAGGGAPMDGAEPPASSDPGDPDDPADPADPSEVPSPDLGDDSGPGALPEGTTPGGVEITCESDEPGITPLMKLSTVQYRNTVRDLLAQSGMEALSAVAEEPLAAVPDDSLGDSFRGADPRVSLEHVQGYLDVGRAIGDALIADSTALESAAGACALDETLSDECARDFLSRFLELAYRRPVSDADLAPYLELNDGSLSPAATIRAMVVVAMSSPRFVNHLEIDGTASSTNGDLLQLTSYEIASRLSYTFWQTMPDAELFQAAADGALATEEGFNAQLDRVFDDPRTRQTLWQFWNEWLKLEKFTGFETSRPAFQALTEETAFADDHDYWSDMVGEVRTLTDVLTFDQSSTIEDVLMTNLSVTTSPELAALYGVEAYSGSGDYPVMPEGTRAGLFQRAALLASNLEQTNPFHRGALVRRSLLCEELPQPDPNTLPPGSLDPPPVDSAQTTRERFQAKVEGNGLCETCHGSFSDIGYVLEAFDAIGRHRTVEVVYDVQNGEELAELPIDTSAVARIDGSDDTLVMGPVDLANRMVASQKVEACLAENYFLYTLRREVEPETGDQCQITDLAALLRDPEAGLASAFRRVAQYDGFFQRKVGPR